MNEYSAQKIDTLKAFALLTGSALCFLAIFYVFYIVFVSGEYTEGSALWEQPIKQSLFSNGRGYIAPIVLFVASAILLGNGLVAMRRVALHDTALTVVYGFWRGLGFRKTIDLTHIASITGEVKPWRSTLILVDNQGKRVSLELAEFKPTDIAWLKPPLEALLQNPSVTKNEQANLVVTQWFGMAT
jgi:hypothetical protein